MISTQQELNATLRYMTSVSDALTAIYLDAKGKSDFTLFPVIAESYFAQIRECSAEVRAYLDATAPIQDQTLCAPPAQNEAA